MHQEADNALSNRFAGEADEAVRRIIGEERLRLSPEEYAARYIHLWGCFSFDRFAYRDPALGAWVHRLGELFRDSEEVERCRELFLTPEELAEVRRQEAEGL
jgi:hypothetical protein